jgi:hypothetical protein
MFYFAFLYSFQFRPISALSRLLHIPSQNYTYSVFIQCVRKVAVHLGYGTYIWLSVSKVPLTCAVVSRYSVVKQRLKCNASKVCNCLIRYLLTMVRGHHFHYLL